MTQLNRKGMSLVLICFAWCVQTHSQNKTVYSIGDKFPLQTLVTLLRKQGYQNLTQKDFQNKCLLIDFWNMWCHSCWKGMKAIDDLQKEFANDLVIVKITANKKTEIEATEHKLNIGSSPVLSVTDDSTMIKFFPHIGDPLHLWIDKGGVIRHSAYGHNATSKNMTAFIKGQPLDLSIRGDMGVSAEPKSLLENAATTLASAVVGYSVFVKGVHEYASLASFEKKTPSRLPAIAFYQVSLLDLFRSAYFQEVYGFEQPRFFTGNNRMVLAVKDSQPFVKPIDSNKIDGWNNRYLLSYEAAGAQTQGSFKTLQTDLEKYFPYQVRVETKNVLCRVLVWTDSKQRFVPQPEQSDKVYEFKCSNVSMQAFFNSLLVATQQDPLPLLSDVEWDKPISIHFESKLEDVAKEKKELRSYGLDIVEQVKQLKVLVIEDQAGRGE